MAAPSYEDIPLAFRHGLTAPRGPTGIKGLFRVEHGVPLERVPAVKPPRTLDTLDEMLQSKRIGETLRTTFKPDMTVVPKHVAAAGVVLTFEGFFKEAVVESGHENCRIRKVVFRYHVEDDTCRILESKVENSGIEPGAFMKRHQLPKAGGGVLHWTDFAIGADLNIYGRVFRITGADDFTRRFFSDNGTELEENIPVPADSYTTLRETLKARETGSDPTGYYGKKANPMKRFMEASLGNPSAVQIRGITDTKKKFLDHDRVVLRFHGIWDDTGSVYGSKLKYTIHYYVADDTVEVLEVHEPNCGRQKFGPLLKRQPLPKQVLVTDDRARGIEDDKGSGEYYTADDFTVGSTINVLGRDILLYDADKFTHDWVLANRGVDMKDLVVDVTEPAAAPLAVPPPPHTGYGTEEDSLGSVFHLVLKAPKKDHVKQRKYDGVVLRFDAHIKDASPIDALRKFLVAWYPENDTLAIFEPPQRNTGIVGGKFMAREKIRNADTGNFFATSDFTVGAEIVARGQRFVLDAADGRTAEFLAAAAAEAGDE